MQSISLKPKREVKNKFVHLININNINIIVPPKKYMVEFNGKSPLPLQAHSVWLMEHLKWSWSIIHPFICLFIYLSCIFYHVSLIYYLLSYQVNLYNLAFHFLFFLISLDAILKKAIMLVNCKSMVMFPNLFGICDIYSI